MSETSQRARFEPLDRLEAPTAAFEAALARDRLHHAWLLTGPKGLGKAGFAWRAARRLLGAGVAGTAMESAPDDPVNRLIAARAHPDLLVLERETEDGKPRRNIPVDEIRRLPEFFAKAPARAGYRVALVDAVDDLAAGGANALLKTLEEPPARGVLLLVSHAPGRLLPTIRSRCRRLAFEPWSETDLADWLQGRGEPSVAAAGAARAARGSPGAALTALAQKDEAEAVLRWVASGDEAALLRAADGFRGGEGALRFAALLTDLADALRTRLALAAEDGATPSEAWVRAWEGLVRLPGEAEALNLDRADAFWAALADLRAAARAQPLPSLTAMLIDSHVNLHAPAFDTDREEVIIRAREAGVGLMVNICDRLSNLEAVRAVAEAHADIWHTVGTHPHEAKENPQLTAQDLIRNMQSPRVVGVGECGLDFHYDLSPREVQRAVFAVHIDAARETGLPLIVHTRGADADMAAMLEEGYARGPFRMLMHCYTSGPDLLRRAAAIGAWFSVSGIATFKAAEDVRALVRDMPADRIIVETDCPYLAPMPMRGKRNEPSYLPHVLAKLAELRGWGVEEAEMRTADAFLALFDRIPRPQREQAG